MLFLLRIEYLVFGWYSYVLSISFQIKTEKVLLGITQPGNNYLQQTIIINLLIVNYESNEKWDGVKEIKLL